MHTRELIWTFEMFNTDGAFNRTLAALRKDQLTAAAQFARLDHARLLGAVRSGKAHSKLGEVKLPPFYLPEVKDAIDALDQHVKHETSTHGISKAVAADSVAPETRPKLPSKDAREAALRRAGYKCQSCGLAHHAVGYRNDANEFIPCRGDTYRTPAGKGRSWPSGELLMLAEAKQIAALLNCTIKRQVRCDNAGHHWLVIVLTVLHDPRKKSVSPEDLVVLCRHCKAAQGS